MMVIRRLLLLALLAGFCDGAIAQEVPVPIVISSDQFSVIQTQDMELLTLSALRREFPRLSGVFASAHSCRLPEYGPFVSVTIQLPSYYFTRPVLLELDRRQRVAEEQARKMRDQLQRAAQLISLRSKEAGLMQQIDWEESSKSKSKVTVNDLQAQLVQVRKVLDSLESAQPQGPVLEESIIELNDVDLNKMLVDNYQQLIQRVTKAMKNSLAENAPRIEGLKDFERVSMNAFIRDNILGSPGRSILFILHPKDIRDYKAGNISLDTLRQRVLVQDDIRE